MTPSSVRPTLPSLDDVATASHSTIVDSTVVTVGFGHSRIVAVSWRVKRSPHDLA
jgi:hypothetical protein